MINLVTSNSIIIDYLSKYPESLKQSCAEALLLYGIRSVKSKFPYGLTAPQLFSVSGLSIDIKKPLDSNFSQPVPKTFAEIIEKSEEITERFQISVEKTERCQKSEENWKPSKKTFKILKKIKDFGAEVNHETSKGVVTIAEEFLGQEYAAYLTEFRS